MATIIKKFLDDILKIVRGFNPYTKSLIKLAQDLNASNNVMLYDSYQDLSP